MEIVMQTVAVFNIKHNFRAVFVNRIQKEAAALEGADISSEEIKQNAVSGVALCILRIPCRKNLGAQCNRINIERLVEEVCGIAHIGERLNDTLNIDIGVLLDSLANLMDTLIKN